MLTNKPIAATSYSQKESYSKEFFEQELSVNLVLCCASSLLHIVLMNTVVSV